MKTKNRVKEGFSSREEPEARDYLYALEWEFNIDAQLIAIRGLLNRNRKASAELADEIKQAEERIQRLKGDHADWAVDDRVDQIHRSAYQEAAHSMSAIGMLAPFVETVFYQYFRGIGNRFFPATNPLQNHDRWKAAHAMQWDCHMFIGEGRPHKDLVRGILQLSEALGFLNKLPNDVKPTLSALFAYRNNMFHLGFEWPIEDSKRFARRIAQEAWPRDWFAVATTNDKPWIFYMSGIEHVLTTIEDVLDAMGLFVRDKLLELSP